MPLKGNICWQSIMFQHFEFLSKVYFPCSPRFVFFWNHGAPTCRLLENGCVQGLYHLAWLLGGSHILMKIPIRPWSWKRSYSQFSWIFTPKTSNSCVRLSSSFLYFPGSKRCYILQLQGVWICILVKPPFRCGFCCFFCNPWFAVISQNIFINIWSIHGWSTAHHHDHIRKSSTRQQNDNPNNQ